MNHNRSKSLLVASLGIAAVVVLSLFALEKWTLQGKRKWLETVVATNRQLTPDQIRAQLQSTLLSNRDIVIPILMRDLRRQPTFFDAAGRWITANSFNLWRWRPSREAEDVRTRAASLLGQLGTNAEIASPQLWSNLHRALDRQPNGREARQIAMALILIHRNHPESLTELISLTNFQRIELIGTLLWTSVEPTNSLALKSLQRLLSLDPQMYSSLIETAEVLERLGPFAALAASDLKLALAKSYLDWPLSGLARMAHATWRADGNPDLALQVLRRSWLEFEQERKAANQETNRAEISSGALDGVYEVVRRLGSIPEVAREIRPLLTSLPPNSPGIREALKCLEPVPGIVSIP